MLKEKNTVRTVGIMLFATLATKVLGLLREIVIASQYGTGSEATAFSAASQIPVLLFDTVLGAAILSSFIPVFNTYLQKEQKEEAIKFSNNFLNIVILISGLFSIIAIVFSKNLINIIAPGLDENTYSIAIKLLPILMPIMVFTAAAFAFVGILQSLGEFNVPAMISLVSNTIVIVYLFTINKTFGIYGLAVAMLFGWFAQAAVQIPFAIKKGYSYSLILNFRSPGITQVFSLAVPIIISSWVQPVNTMVNIGIASYLNNGQAIPAIRYANTLYIIAAGVLTYAVTNLIFPSLSRLSAGKEEVQFAKLVNTAVRGVVFLIVPVMVCFLVLRLPIIQLIYERGEFTKDSTLLTSNALFFYSFGMLGFALQDILNKCFYALHDAATPMKVGFTGLIINVILSFSLSKIIGIGGLALAASIASVIMALILIIFINRKVKGIFNKDMLPDLIKILTSALVMGIVTTIVYNTINSEILVFVPALAGISVYFLLSYIFKIEEAKIAVNIIRGIFKR